MHEAIRKQPNLRSQPALLAGMALALLLFYQGGALAPALLGLAGFGALALLRPDLALLFVPLTAPLYLIPGELPGLRANGFDLPLHEAALLLTFAASLARWLWSRLPKPAGPPALAGLSGPAYSSARLAPALLFLVAGALGLALALARGPALIELRRMVVEPLLFYTLARRQLAADLHVAFANGSSQLKAHSSKLIAALALGGALVSLIGLLQYVGLDLAPLLGPKQCFAPDGGVCPNVIADGGVRRVLSVYGHPNNLGLFLGRVWPLAAALALAGVRAKRQAARAERAGSRFDSWLWALGALLCLAGIGVSFSRGAWLGALAAAVVLALGFIRARNYRPQAQPATGAKFSVFGSRLAARGSLLALALTALVLAGLALSLRGDVTAGSTPVRLLLWREALGYIARHPLGIGLDQFATYHDPKSGLSLIDPALIGTSEQFAAHPHNLLLDIWLRLGPLGLLAFGWLLWRFFRATLRRGARPLAIGASAAMAAALVHGLVDNFYFVSDLAIVFWLLIALSEALDSVA